MAENNIDDIFNITAGKVLKKYREQKKLSLEELAKKMTTNITRQSLFKYENGKARLKNNIYLDICHALNLNPKDVFNEINEQASLISKKIYTKDDYAEALTNFMIGLEYNNSLLENNLEKPNYDTSIIKELEILFNKIKYLFTEEEIKKISTLLEEKKWNLINLQK